MKNKLFGFLKKFNILIIVVLVNVLLISWWSIKIDLTKSKVHTVSKISRNIVKELEDIVVIKVYLTENLPPTVRPISKSLKQILKELESANKNKLRISYLDPNKDENAKKDVEKYGIQRLQFSEIKSDSFEVLEGYFGLVIIYGSKQLVLPIAGDIGNLEYYIVSGIKKLVSDKVVSVGIIEDSNNPSSEINYLRKYLERDYVVVDLAVDQNEDFSDSLDTILIIGSSAKWNEKNIGKLKNWVNKNKGLIILDDRIAVDDKMTTSKLNNTYFENFLKDLGVEVLPKLVIDDSAAIANFKVNNGSYILKYPYWLSVRIENIDQSSPAFTGINSLLLPWVSPIAYTNDFKPVIKSSNKSALDEQMIDVTPKKIDLTKENNQQVLAVMKNKIIVFGDSDLIKDQFVVSNQNNLMAMVNLLDYVSSDSKLLTIRTKSLTVNPLISIDDKFKNLIKIINLIIPIGFLLITALVTKLFRQKHNRQYEKE